VNLRSSYQLLRHDRHRNFKFETALDHQVASGSLILKFVSERAANAYELRNRTTRECPDWRAVMVFNVSRPSSFRCPRLRDGSQKRTIYHCFLNRNRNGASGLGLEPSLSKI
jgi:hypothetical protein